MIDRDQSQDPKTCKDEEGSEETKERIDHNTEM